MNQKILITGAGGFIAHHMVNYLKDKGLWVRAVDIVEPEFENSNADEFKLLDLRLKDAAEEAVEGVDQVYHLAADMGGIGYITAFHADISRNNILMNTHMLEAARLEGVERFFYSSSACVYPDYRQDSNELDGLKEEDAYPAAPEEGYGWEKLFTEKLCQYYTQDYDLQTRVARFHNVYGPLGTFDGGKEKAPAALCRKIAKSNSEDDIEVWGDGEQTRSFMYIDDCVEGIYRLMQSNHNEPLNLGTDLMVSVNQLVDIIASVAGKKINKIHDLSKPQGVRGRNSDNTKLSEFLNWTPDIDLKDGMKITYEWINNQVN